MAVYHCQPVHTSCVNRSGKFRHAKPCCILCTHLPLTKFSGSNPAGKKSWLIFKYLSYKAALSLSSGSGSVRPPGLGNVPVEPAGRPRAFHGLLACFIRSSDLLLLQHSRSARIPREASLPFPDKVIHPWKRELGSGTSGVRVPLHSITGLYLMIALQLWVPCLAVKGYVD